ncbi:hypothetical protein NQ117_21220 [Paenibacillus sp. SC116]|uniref:hypothetical protein n=1 Tax=Paenibacillus sp. SC116 TaxID=2968986 RepID=UPI00215B5689|nr:hypothetical protein [Paenibacillus sp. SC116]MCR8846209.1 hypothetical protein [Paenibacillus sp. SC116]
MSRHTYYVSVHARTVLPYSTQGDEWTIHATEDEAAALLGQFSKLEEAETEALYRGFNPVIDVPEVELNARSQQVVDDIYNIIAKLGTSATKQTLSQIRD